MKNIPINKEQIIKLVLFMILSNLVACDLLSNKPEKVEFLNNAYSVTMPASWSLRSDLNDVADVQMGNAYKEAYVIVISENKMDFEKLTLEGHSDLTRSSIKQGLKNYKESAPEYLSKGNFKTLRYRLTGSIEGLNLVYWHVTIESKIYFHQMLLWSLKSKFPDNKADDETVIHSFEAMNE
jgi:hypothetical protein